MLWGNPCSGAITCTGSRLDLLPTYPTSLAPPPHTVGGTPDSQSIGELASCARTPPIGSPILGTVPHLGPPSFMSTWSCNTPNMTHFMCAHHYAMLGYLVLEVLFDILRLGTLRYATGPSNMFHDPTLANFQVGHVPVAAILVDFHH